MSTIEFTESESEGAFVAPLSDAEIAALPEAQRNDLNSTPTVSKGSTAPILIAAVAALVLFS